MKYHDKSNLYSFINNSSLLFNSLTNINYLKYKKNNKIIRFTLLCELIYMLISQSNNYKYLYYNLINQLNLIKQKLLFRINETIEKNKNNDIIKMIKKLKLSNENFISLIFLNEKNYIEKNLFSKEIKDIKLILNKDSLYIKYINIMKIRKFINKFIYIKLELLNSFFYKKIFFLLKRETHQESLEVILSKILKKYFTINFNINISRQSLQEYLLELFMKSNIFYPKFALNHYFIKRHNMSIMHKDILSDAKNILNIYLKKNYNFSYFKYKNKIKINNLSSHFINKLKELSFNNKLFVISNIFEDERLIFRFLKNNKIYSIKNNFFYEKNYFNIYILYYFFNDLFYQNNYFYDLINKFIFYININLNIKYKFFQFIEKEIENKIINNISIIDDYLEINEILENKNINQIEIETLLKMKINLNEKEQEIKDKINKYLNEFKDNLYILIINFFIDKSIIDLSKNSIMNIDKIIQNKLNFSELLNKINIFQKNNFLFKLYLKKIKNIISKINNINKLKLNKLDKLKIIFLKKNLKKNEPLINYIINNINNEDNNNKSLIKIYNSFNEKKLITNSINFFSINKNYIKILHQYFQYNIKIYYFNNLNVKKSLIEDKDFFFRDKKINIFVNLLKLTKKNFSIIKKNNLFFLFNEIKESFNEIHTNSFDKIDSFNNLNNYNRIFNKIIDYNTDEIKKVTRHTTLFETNEDLKKYIKR